MEAEAEKKLLKFVNEELVVQSLLYDMDLLPEQIRKDSKSWPEMLNIVQHFKAAKNKWTENSKANEPQT